ncbi:Ribonuclease H-like domain containing protein [Amanita muscaria]
MLLVYEIPNRRDTLMQTDQVMSRLATWRSPAVPVAENPRFDVHPDFCPLALFSLQLGYRVPDYRFVNKGDPKQVLLFIDGATSGNGTPNARAGYAVYVAPQFVSKRRLGGAQTSNRAELSAAIDALSLRSWRGEGFTSVVLATDSEYVVKGFCENMPKWKSREWRTSAGTPVANKDLWVSLNNMIEFVANDGAQVLFWWIPRRWNEADKYAKEAARDILCYYDALTNLASAAHKLQLQR